jgi:hypothetical protein
MALFLPEVKFMLEVLALKIDTSHTLVEVNKSLVNNDQAPSPRQLKLMQN